MGKVGLAEPLRQQRAGQREQGRCDLCRSGCPSPQGQDGATAPPPLGSRKRPPAGPNRPFILRKGSRLGRGPPVSREMSPFRERGRASGPRG